MNTKLGYFLFAFFWSLTVLICFSSAQDYFWILADVHHDPTYETSRESCNEGVREGALGQYGDYECDSPWSLIDSSVRAMKILRSAPKFFFWIGDVVPHYKNSSILSEEHILTHITNITVLINEVFPGVPVYPCLGNHDYYPTSQLPPNTSNIYVIIATSIWNEWLGAAGAEREENVRTFSIGGYYTKLMPEVGPNIRCVVLNTNLYLSDNKVTSGLSDPAGQFEWLNATLLRSRASQEKVHILTHAPPGLMEGEDARWFSEEFNRRFNDLLSEFSDIIVAVYAGHQHLDSFKIFYKKDKTPGSVLLLAPSVTPWRARLPGGVKTQAHNPAIRRVLYDKYTPEKLLDVEQFYVPLTDTPGSSLPEGPARRKGLEDPWTALYTYRQSYGVSEITGTSMEKVIDKFEIYGSQTFHDYYLRHTVNSRHESNTPCGCECKFKHICAMRNIPYDEYEACFQDAPCSSNIGPSGSLIWAVVFSVLFLALRKICC